jgi:hypothetical protein
MTTIIEVSEEGTLVLPGTLLSNPSPHAQYRVEVENDRLVLMPVSGEAQAYKNQSAADQVREFREWVASLPKGPGLSDEAVSRESMYD